MKSRLMLVVPMIVMAATVPPPPKTEKVEVVDELHGVKIADPYRWLEDQNSPQTRAWIKEQTAYTRSLLDPLPGRAELKKRLTELMTVETISLPRNRHGKFFYSKRKPGQDQSVLYVKEGGAEKVLFDPNTLGGGYSAAFAGVSKNGSIAVYRLQKGGEDEAELHILDVSTAKETEAKFAKQRYGSVAFLPDQSGFYYSKTDQTGSRVYFHKLGTDIGADREIFGSGYNSSYFALCSVEEDRYLLCRASLGSTSDNGEVFVGDLKAGGELKPVIRGLNARFFPAGIGGGVLYVRTDWNAPNGKVLAIDLKKPQQEFWKEFVPESSSALERVELIGGRVATISLENVQFKVRLYEPSGKNVGEVKLPGLGSIGQIAGEWEEDTAYYSFESFGQPPTIYEYSVKGGTQKVWAKQNVPFDGSTIDVKQVWFASKDGTKIPMFVAHKKGVKRDGNAPLLMTGYGGFLLSETPEFSAYIAAWLEKGGVFALPTLRGGGEFGEKWHRAGMLENKQNVFDDFIGAAQFLIAEKYTNPKRLGIYGGSNGGLLVGAALTQKPELYAAVICSVPLLDMVRYHQFKVARWWVPEYGSSADEKQFQWLYKYSPYHHVDKGARYPAVMFTTGDSDTRVDPLHARKMTALVQESNASGKPIMLLYDTEAGHSRGLPVKKLAEDYTDRLSFFFWQLGLL